MAFDAATVWEVRTTGSDTNGGGFVSGSGTDYSQQDSPQLSVTDGACSGTATLTSATGGFTSAMIGNVVYLSSGPGWYQITARTDTNTVTLDRAGPSATGMTVNVGGALATVTKASAVNAGGNIIWVKNGSYTITAYLQPTDGIAAANTVVVGYYTTRGDLDDSTDFVNYPTIQVNNTSMTGIVAWSGYTSWRNFILDGGAGPSGPSYGLWGLGAGNSQITNVKVYRCGYGGSQAVQIQSGCSLNQSLVTDSRSGADCGIILFGGYVRACVITNNPCSGLRGAGSGTVISTASHGNTGSGGYGMRFDNGDACLVINSIFYNNSQTGLFLTSGARSSLFFNQLVSNGGYGVQVSGTSYTAFPGNWNAYYGNTSGEIASAPDEVNHYTLTADPFIDASTGDFNINNVSGGGALLRAVTFDLPG